MCMKVNHAILPSYFFQACPPIQYASDESDCMPWFLRLILLSFAYQSGQPTAQYQNDLGIANKTRQVFTCMHLSRACIEFTEHNAFSIQPISLKKLIQVTDIMYAWTYAYTVMHAGSIHSEFLKDAVVSDTPSSVIGHLNLTQHCQSRYPGSCIYCTGTKEATYISKYHPVSLSQQHVN